MANTLVQTFGAPAVYVRREAGSYNSTTGRRGKADFKVKIKGIFDEYRKNEISDQIQAGDRKFLVAATMIKFEPKMGDEIIIKNRTYRVEDTEGTMSGEEAALWTFQLRGTSG